MKYKNVVKGTFIDRPNRFIALVNIDGRMEKCHVKNTGRCKELFVKDAPLYLEVSDNPNRKTAYDVIGVIKGDTMINIDSQVPNKVVHEWMLESGFLSDKDSIKPEHRYQNSRFDFYAETADQSRKILIEVKGVTLEEDGVARFPDAPTERGIKHMKELIAAKENGYESYLIFVIQMKGVHRFEPNYRTHREFGQVLVQAEKAGVKVLAFDCIVTEDSLKIDQPIKIQLMENK